MKSQRLLLHGDNQVLSRRFLTDLKVRSQHVTPPPELINLDGRRLTLNSLIQACEAPSFFTPDRLVIIEGLHAHPSKKAVSTLVEYLSHQTSPVSVVLWETKTLTAAQLKRLSSFTPKLFKTSSPTFRFLDTLVPRPSSSTLAQFTTACKQDSPEFVFFLLCRHLRLLLQISSPDFKAPSWQKHKLRQQTKHFSAAQLRSFHDRLTDLDWRLKSGQTVGSLQSELRTILVTL